MRQLQVRRDPRYWCLDVPLEGVAVCGAVLLLVALLAYRTAWRWDGCCQALL